MKTQIQMQMHMHLVLSQSLLLLSIRWDSTNRRCKEFKLNFIMVLRSCPQSLPHSQPSHLDAERNDRPDIMSIEICCAKIVVKHHFHRSEQNIFVAIFAFDVVSVICLRLNFARDLDALPYTEGAQQKQQQQHRHRYRHRQIMSHLL